MKSKEVDDEIVLVLTNSLKNYVNDKNIALATNNTEVVKFCETRIIEICSYFNKNDYIEEIANALNLMQKSKIVDESLHALKVEKQAQNITQAVKDTKANSSYDYFDNSELVTSLSEVTNSESFDVYHNLNAKANLARFRDEKELLKVASSSVAVYFYDDLKNMGVELEEGDFYMNKISKFFDNPNISYNQENDDSTIPTDSIEQ